jgi:allantoin racemase
MKLLLINPNTSEHVSARMLSAAQASLGRHAQVVAVTGVRGPAVVGSRTENTLAAAHAVELAAEHAKNVDAVVLGISTDAGLAALRELLHVPVTGMLEAALMSAAQLGSRIGLLTLGQRMLPLYQEQVQAYAMGARMVAWCGATLPALYSPNPGPEAIDLLCEQALAMVDQNDLDVLILSGAVLAGYRDIVAQRLPVPLVDGTEAACWQAFALAQMKPGVHARGSYATPSQRKLTAMGQAMQDLIGLSEG